MRHAANLVEPTIVAMASASRALQPHALGVEAMQLRAHRSKAQLIAVLIARGSWLADDHGLLLTGTDIKIGIGAEMLR